MSQENAANDPMNFVKNMWGNMGFSLPGMVTPTFDVEEIEKRVKDMKAVEGWLKMNLSMLQMTIQSLEMQCATLNAVRAMGNMAASQPPAENTPAPAAPAPAGEGAGESSAPPTMWPWNLMQQMQEQMQQAASKPAAEAEETPKNAARRRKKSQ